MKWTTNLRLERIFRKVLRRKQKDSENSSLFELEKSIRGGRRMKMVTDIPELDQQCKRGYWPGVIK